MTNYSFFIDIDGTLISSRNRSISENVRDTILAARSEGAKFFINTARSRTLIPPELSDPNIFDGVCTGGGTFIEFGGRCVYSRYIDEEVVCSVAAAMLRHKEKTVLCFEGSEHMYYMGQPQDWFGENFFPVESPDDFLTKYKGAKIQKFATTSAIRPSGEFLAELSVRFEILDHKRYVEAMEYGYNKGGAIRIAERELSIPHDSTVAIGDSKNDLSMLSYAAVSVAMGNATDEVKNICTFTTESVENDGVACAVRKLCRL